MRCRCFWHSLISETDVLPTPATSKVASIRGRIEITSSPKQHRRQIEDHDARPEVSLDGLQQRPIVWEAIHSEELGETDPGSTNMLFGPMLACRTADESVARPSSTLRTPPLPLNAQIICDHRLAQIEIHQQHRPLRQAAQCSSQDCRRLRFFHTRRSAKSPPETASSFCPSPAAPGCAAYRSSARADLKSHGRQFASLRDERH